MTILIQGENIVVEILGSEVGDNFYFILLEYFEADAKDYRGLFNRILESFEFGRRPRNVERWMWTATAAKIEECYGLSRP